MRSRHLSLNILTWRFLTKSVEDTIYVDYWYCNRLCTVRDLSITYLPSLDFCLGRSKRNREVWGLGSHSSRHVIDNGPSYSFHPNTECWLYKVTWNHWYTTKNKNTEQKRRTEVPTQGHMFEGVSPPCNDTRRSNPVIIVSDFFSFIV